MNPNKALWERGDFTEIAAFMRQSGEAVIESMAIKPPLRVPEALPAGPHGIAVTVTSRPGTWLKLSKKRTIGGLPQPAEVSGRRCLQSGRRRRPLVRNGHFRVRRHVCPEALRRRKGDGARHKTRRPHCHGKLDSQRSLRMLSQLTAPIKISFGVYSSAGRLRQSDDVGRGKSHYRALWRSGSAQGKDLHGEGHVLLCPRREKKPGGVHRSIRKFYGPTMNAVDAP